MKKTLCVDFDGVLHSYDSGWKGACEIPDGPVKGAIEWLEAATHRFKVCVYSSRSKEPGAIDAMIAWLRKHGASVSLINQLEFPTQKPAAFLTVDDRAICFDGTWPDLELMEQFKPWNKRDFPRGNVGSGDGGEIAMKVGHNGNTVMIRFEKPLAWIGLGASHARALAASLLKFADEVES